MVIVGLTEVAVMLGVKRDTVVQWVYRGVAPDRDFTIDGKPAWYLDTITAWAKETGRA